MHLLLALIACKGGDPSDAPDDTSPTTGDVTWYADVKPVVDTHCVRCHHDGGLGTGDFTNPTVATAMSEIMLREVEAGRMPPPASDPGCRDYVGSDHLTLSDDEQAVFSAWVEGGSPLGDPASDPGLEPVLAELTDADLTLLMPGPYTPTWWDEANPGNEYRCFVLDPGHTETLYINALQPVVDQDAMVHHEVLFTARRDAVAELSGPEGFNCIDGSSGVDTEDMIAAWAPGMLPVEFPDGMGLALPADQVLVLQMHYFRNGSTTDGVADRSGYALRTLSSVSSQMYLAPMGIFDFNIPAGAEAHQDGDELFNSYIDLDLYGIFPHMHVQGTWFNAEVEHADGSTDCLVDGPYSFDNQMTYTFSEPARFERGSTVRYTCTWNNSESNPALAGREIRDTRYGERTDEEMCYFFTYLALSL